MVVIFELVVVDSFEHTCYVYGVAGGCLVSDAFEVFFDFLVLLVYGSDFAGAVFGVDSVTGYLYSIVEFLVGENQLVV